jgi:hypothetical protein
MSYYLKDPASIAEYQLDWSPWLGGAVTLTASSWTIVPAESGGLQRLTDTLAGASTTLRASGGAAGKVYRATNRVDLSDGRREERTLAVRVEDR